MNTTTSTASVSPAAAATSLATTRYQLDPSTRPLGNGAVVLGGSPLRLFRLTDAGRNEFARISRGEPVGRSSLSERLLDAGAIHPVVTTNDAVDDGGRVHCPGDVTVVVPTHQNEPARLYDILRHCLDTAGVVFVDDGSDLPLTGVRGATVVRLRHNSGPAAARNAGYKSIETPLIAFVDTDVDLHLGWLDGLLGHFDDDKVGLVAPRVASGTAPEGAAASVARYETRHSPLDLGGDPGRIAPGTRVSYVPAAAIVVRRDALDGIGGFDTSFRSGEDVDLAWRLHAAGWRCRYEPTVVVEHRPRPSWRALAEQRITYGGSAAALAEVHGSAVAPVRISPWSLGVWALAASGRWFTAAGVAAGTAAALVAKLPDVPAEESLRLAGRGHLQAGRSLAEALRRAWLPLLGIAALCSRRARRVAAAAAIQALLDGGTARLFDDISYGIGVWKGVLRSRRLAPLLPALSNWPARADT